MRWLPLIALAGCGRIDFDTGSDPAGELAPPCDEPWSAPVLVDVAAAVANPSVRGDNLELFADGGGHLYVSHRTSKDVPWGPAELLPSPPNSLDEGAQYAAISDDGLELVYTRLFSGNAYLGESTRTNIRAPWQLSTIMGHGGADLSRDRLTLYSSDQLFPISITRRAAVSEPFVGPEAPLPEPINAVGSMNALESISSDERELYFDSDRGGAPALYVARRPARTSATWTVESLNIPMYYDGVDISADGHFLYFTGTDNRIYMISRCE